MAQKETEMEDARVKNAAEVDTNILSLREGVASYLHDADPEETQEWMDSLDGLLEASDPERARYLMLRLIERAVGIGLIGQERAEGRLMIARGPDFADGVERARLPAQEQCGAVVRLRVVERRVPVRAVEVGCRMDEEHRRAAGLSTRLLTRGRPQGGVVADIGPRQP